MMIIIDYLDETRSRTYSICGRGHTQQFYHQEGHQNWDTVKVWSSINRSMSKVYFPSLVLVVLYVFVLRIMMIIVDNTVAMMDVMDSNGTT